MHSAIRRTGVAAATAALVFGAGTSTAMGAENPPFTTDFPAGLACAGFDLRVEGSGGHQQFRQFTDRDGNVVGSISAGTGSALTFTNLSTDATVSFKSNGSTTRHTFGSDGTTTTRMTGHNVLILFPSDVPAGPSTTLYVGQVVYTVGTDGVWTLKDAKGNSTDICAALAD
jgi:hypothetical protein